MKLKTPVSQTKAPDTELENSPDLPSLLNKLSIAIAITSASTQKIFFFLSKTGKELNSLAKPLDKPAAIALGNKSLAACSGNQILFFSALVQQVSENKLSYNFIPRSSHITGNIATHQLRWFDEELYLANTQFSCICTLEPNWSFNPIWKPDFITELAAEDRCHLNGFCFDSDGLKIASALSNTNVKDGWRENKANSGILIDIPSNQIIAKNLCMPHSPIIHRDKLWFLEAGKGQLNCMDLTTKQVTTIAEGAGFARGLALHDKYAFVGLSRIRKTAEFADLPVTNKEQINCGIITVDIEEKKIINFMTFTEGMNEIFDLEIIPNADAVNFLTPDDPQVNSVVFFPNTYKT